MASLNNTIKNVSTKPNNATAAISKKIKYHRNVVRYLDIRYSCHSIHDINQN
ncbi:pyridoxal phosphate-dependent aminotransferase, partial [Francisella tularensis subsp. holarctica]|nr:pyridoxal phosphate-dependent aminotransferase [Francisella tularensis subsp. holarctica]